MRDALSGVLNITAMLWIGNGQLLDRRPDGRTDKCLTSVSKVHYKSLYASSICASLCLNAHVSNLILVTFVFYPYNEWLIFFLKTLDWRYNHSWWIKLQETHRKNIIHTIDTASVCLLIQFDIMASKNLLPEWETGITLFGMCHMKSFVGCLDIHDTLFLYHV